MKTIRAWFAKLFTKETPMADENQTADAGTLAAVLATAASAAAAPAPVVITDTDRLKALLLALGHDVSVEWDHLVALSKKLA
jgi:hypothetical protein